MIRFHDWMAAASDQVSSRRDREQRPAHGAEPGGLLGAERFAPWLRTCSKRAPVTNAGYTRDDLGQRRVRANCTCR